MVDKGTHSAEVEFSGVMPIIFAQSLMIIRA